MPKHLQRTSLLQPIQKNFEESKKVAKQGGNVAKVARKELEAKTGKNVVTSYNAKGLLKEKDDTEKEEIQK